MWTRRILVCGILVWKSTATRMPGVCPEYAMGVPCVFAMVPCVLAMVHVVCHGVCHVVCQQSAHILQHFATDTRHVAVRCYILQHFPMNVDYGEWRHFCDDHIYPDPVWKLSMLCWLRPGWLNQVYVWIILEKCWYKVIICWLDFKYTWIWLQVHTACF